MSGRGVDAAWAACLARLDQLYHGDHPPVIKAHYLVRVLLPRIARKIGARAVAEEFGKATAEKMLEVCGVCALCAEATRPPDDDCCAACVEEIDRLILKSERLRNDE